MQLTLIFGIIAAIGAVLFALQNDAPVAVTLAVWRFEGSLAFVLLVALGLGALIAGLFSSPTVIRGQWTAARLRRQVVDLEKELAEHKRRENEKESTHRIPAPGTEEPEKPYVGLRELLTGGDAAKTSADPRSPGDANSR